MFFSFWKELTQEEKVTCLNSLCGVLVQKLLLAVLSHRQYIFFFFLVNTMPWGEQIHENISFTTQWYVYTHVKDSSLICPHCTFLEQVLQPFLHSLLLNRCQMFLRSLYVLWSWLISN